MMDDAKRQERELERRRREQRLVNAYQRAFAGEDGQAVLEDLTATFRLTERVFTPVQIEKHYAYDPLTAALADGARGVVIYIRAKLAAKAQGDGNLAPREKVIR